MATHRRGPAEHRYVHVQVRLWEDERVLGLDQPPPNSRDLYLYLVCGPFTTRVPGLVHGGRAALAEALGWGIEDFDHCWRQVEAAGLALADWRARIVYLPDAFSKEENRPCSTSTVVTWHRELANLPNCPLLQRVRADLCLALRCMNPVFLQSFELGTRAGFGQPEQSESPTSSPTQLATESPTSLATQSPRDSLAPALSLSLAPALSPSLEESAREAPAYGTPPLELIPQEPPQPRKGARRGSLEGKGDILLGKPENAAQARAVNLHRSQAAQVLAALNTARREVNSEFRELTPTYQNLGGIAARLAAGNTTEDCLHVIAVYKAECLARPDSQRWFNSSTPFVAKNFTRALGQVPSTPGAAGETVSRPTPKVRW